MATSRKKTASVSTTKKTPVDDATDSTRVIKKSTYKSFRLHKKIRPVQYTVLSSWKLFRRSIGTIKRYWKLFFGITVIYGILTVILVKGFGSSAGLTELKDVLNDSVQGAGGKVTTGASLFVYLLGSSGNSADAGAGVYQSILLLIVSLAFIWALRQVYALETKKALKIRIRDAYYRGMSPLVPFILVFMVILLELIPLAIGSFLYSTVISNGIAVEAIEKILWIMLFAASAILSLYLIISTMFALYIVALPDMTPMRALRSARGLVKYRRWMVARKLLVFIILLFLSAAAFMIPLILFATAWAEWAFFILGILGITITHSYLYALYRELLHE